MKKRLLALTALLFITGTFTFVQAQTHARESPILGSIDDNNSAYFISSGFHFGKGNFVWQPTFQRGTYLTNHLSWLIGVRYNMNRVKYEMMDLSGNTYNEKLKTRTLSVPLSLRYGFGSDVPLVQVHAGVSYNYIMSMRMGGVKQDLTGIKRGYFTGHVRLSGLMLFFLEYEFMFNGGGGMFYYGLCLDF